ncbi:MAG TPA: glycosyltransferase [Candidatus Baltobacteraceae bacterium]|nr:glycosyltransferase [Candidatus Baltobacteraceae bacterium]
MNTCCAVDSISRNAGGLQHSVRRLHQSLNELPGVKVSVASLEDEYSTQDEHHWKPLPVSLSRVVGPRAFGYSPEFLPKLMELNADILQGHGIWQYPSLAANRWHQKTRRPYLVSPHGMLDAWAVRNSAWKKRIARWCFEGEHLQKAACLRALCESEAQSIRAFGLTNPVAVIPNGIDVPENKGRGPEAGDHESLWNGEIEPGRKVLMYLGRIHPKKGLVNLLNAWAEVQRSTVNGRKPGEWVLAVAGWDQGGHEAELKKLATDLDLLTSVHFIGPQFNEAKARCYRNCDAFVLPSFSEGLPMGVLEAWSYGKPVVITPECNLPEGFTANAALRVEPNVKSVAAGLGELVRLQSADLRALGTNGRTLVAEKFTWPKIAIEMKSVYEWVLGGGAKPDCVQTS